MKKPSLWIALSALLIVASFPPWDASFLIWVALVPFLLKLHEAKTWKQAFASGFWLGFFMSMGGFYWTIYSMKVFGNVPIVLAILLFLGLCIFCQFQFAVFSAGHFYLKNKLPWIFFPFFYSVIDWILPKLFLDHLGHSFYNSPWIRMLAVFGGVHLLTLMIVFVNYGIAEWRRTQKRFPLVASVLVLVVGHAVGYLEKQKLNAIPIAKKISAGVVQANVGDIEKMMARMSLKQAADRVIAKYITLSRELAAKSPDFLVWPETAYPSTFNNPMSPGDLVRDESLKTLVKSHNIPLLFGGYDSEGGKEFNSIFFLEPKDTSKARVYHKGVLLPFGEYVPGFDENGIMKKFFPQMGFFGKGPGPTVMDLTLTRGGSVKIAPIICYEALLSDYVIGGAKLGAELILNVTNDSWFGEHGEPYLHLALSVFRSIETRIPQLRATNTGISALILPDGELVDQTGVFTVDPKIYRIPIRESVPPTFLMRVPYLFPLLSILVVGLYLFRARRTVFNRAA